jgi:hypothetical protein
MDDNLEAQWHIDSNHADEISEWIEWLNFLLDGIECEIEYFEDPYYTCIDFAREEDKTWFVLRWS